MELDDAFAHLNRTYFGEDAKEREEIELLPDLLEGCGLFIDVGASLGQYTFYANQTMEGGRILSIEADPHRFEALKENCAEWSEGSSNSIIPIHAAAGDARGTVEFYVTMSQISGGLFPVAERSDAYRPVRVPQVMLDDYYDPGVPTFVKIDVEGAEFRVMRGAERHMEAGHTEFMTEITWWGDRERGQSTLDFLRYLHGHHLRITKMARRRTSNYLLTPAPPDESVWPSYVRVAPLLVATSLWGRLIPKEIRVLRERALNRRRLRRSGLDPESASGED